MRALAEYERMLDRMTPTEADFDRLLFGPGAFARAILAMHGEMAVGIAIWYHVLSTFNARPILFLEDIFVEPAHRAEGIGLALMRRLAAIALQENCWAMDWNVLNWNQPALDFYRRIGARPITDWTAQRLDAAGMAELASG